jgi:uncharacterized protein (TIGR03086 family)
MTADEATIEADDTVPVIRITRDFAATPAQLIRAHTDPDVFARWIGPYGMTTEIHEWDARNGGAWRYTSSTGTETFTFRGCFHTVADDVIVQTFTYEAMPDDVSLQTLRVEDLGGGRTRLHTQSLVDSFESRDAWLRSGMEGGVNDGYAKLDALTACLESLDAAERHRRIAADFTEHVAAVTDWKASTPVPGWATHDIVDHLVDWSREFLASGGVDLPEMSAPRTDPVAAWSAHSADIQALLDESAPDRVFVHPMIGTHALANAIDRFYTADVFMHTWDLATACGRASGLDPQFAATLVDGMAEMEDVLRSSGQYGAAVAVPADADPVTRLAGFIGRDPAWRPDVR